MAIDRQQRMLPVDLLVKCSGKTSTLTYKIIMNLKAGTKKEY